MMARGCARPLCLSCACVESGSLSARASGDPPDAEEADGDGDRPTQRVRDGVGGRGATGGYAVAVRQAANSNVYSRSRGA
jgi:hypothetical protein